MAWSSFISKSNLIRRRRRPSIEPSSLDTILSELKLDDKLKHILEDLREFSLLAELAYQTTGTLDPSLVNEAMISIMYRILHLSFINNTVEEVLRLGLLIYCTHIFLPGQAFVGRYQHLVDNLRDAFDDPGRPVDQIPVDIRLWLAVMAAILYPPALEDLVVAGVISSALEALRLRSWSDTRGVLKSVLWIGFMHDQPSGIIINTLINSATRTKDDALGNWKEQP